MNFNIPSALSSRPETIWKLHRLTSPCRQLSGPKSGDFNRKKSGFNHQKFGVHHQKWGCICICQWCLSRNEISFVTQNGYHMLSLIFQVSSFRVWNRPFPLPKLIPRRQRRPICSIQHPLLWGLYPRSISESQSSHIVMINIPFPYIHRSCSWKKKRISNRKLWIVYWRVCSPMDPAVKKRLPKHQLSG